MDTSPDGPQPSRAQQQDERDDDPEARKGPEGSDYDKDERTDGDGKADDTGTGRRRLILFVGVVVALLAIGGGAWWWFFARNVVSTDDAFIDAQIVRISPQVAGLLTEVAVQSNDAVKKGDLLVRLEPAGPKADYAKAKATLALAETGVTTAEAQLEQANAAVTQSQSALVAAQVTAENDRRTADRLISIRAESENAAVSQQQVDDAAAAARSAEAMREQARTGVDSAMAGVDAAKAGVAAAKAQVRSAQAGVDASQVTLDQLTLTAPSNGHVVQVMVDDGSYVQPGQPIMALVPDEVHVTANFKETQLVDIHVGQQVDIAIDAYPDVEFHGKVVSIQRGAGQAFQLLPPQNATGNFVKVVQRVPVWISIDSPDPRNYVLGPGMSAIPRIQLDGSK